MIISSEQFNQAYKKLPYVLREYIAEDELATITEEMGHEYHLHVDTVGALYRETTNMLLGLINPEQFVAELKSVGIPQESISPIVAELNTKIFIPLHEKMQHPPEEDEEEVGAPEAVHAAPAAVIPAAAPVAAPIPAVEWVQVTPTAVQVQTAPVAPAVSMPVPPPQPVAVSIAAPAPVAPSAPIVNTPSVSEYSPITQTQPVSPLAPKIQPQSTENRDALHAVLKEYGIDPYREPPE